MAALMAARMVARMAAGVLGLVFFWEGGEWRRREDICTFAHLSCLWTQPSALVDKYLRALAIVEREHLARPCNAYPSLSATLHNDVLFELPRATSLFSRWIVSSVFITGTDLVSSMPGLLVHRRYTSGSSYTGTSYAGTSYAGTMASRSYGGRYEAEDVEVIWRRIGHMCRCKPCGWVQYNAHVLCRDVRSRCSEV